jgi:hypothetical protein
MFRWYGDAHIPFHNIFWYISCAYFRSTRQCCASDAHIRHLIRAYFRFACDITVLLWSSPHISNTKFSSERQHYGRTQQYFVLFQIRPIFVYGPALFVFWTFSALISYWTSCFLQPLPSLNFLAISNEAGRFLTVQICWVFYAFEFQDLNLSVK